MNALWLKLLAYVTMLVDHTSVTLYITGPLRAYPVLYHRWLRGIGRLAFPIFGFLLVQGALHTKHPRRYLFRLILLGFLSEIPFDLALFGRLRYPNYQNVYFTLTAGLISVLLLKRSTRYEGAERLWWTALWASVTWMLAYICEKILFSDYGWGGVLMIAVMGLLVLPAYDIRFMLGSENFYQMMIAAIGIAVCVLLTSPTENPAFLALIPIYFYNGRQGKQPKPLRIGLYAFYPLHLLILGLVFVWPLVRNMYF